MLARFWNYLTSPFRRQPSNVVSTAPVSAHNNSKILPYPSRSVFGRQSAQIHAAQQIINVEYKLDLKNDMIPELSKQQQEKQEMHAEIIDQIYQLSEDLRKLRVSEEKMQSQSAKFNGEIPISASRQFKKDNSIRRQFELKKLYQNQIQDYLRTKYTREKEEYPAISYDQFKNIKDYWENKSRGQKKIKDTGFNYAPKLTYHTMGTLEHGKWLNDQVINNYIELMDKTYIVNKETSFRIIGSYFAQTTLQAKQKEKIEKFLKKKKLNNTNAIIMPINSQNHWYFAVFDKDALVIYDSIKHEKNYYLGKNIFKKSIEFAKMFYGKDFQLIVKNDYPQQNNSFDCGVFMLLGIRDILVQKQWSYNQGDINFKRIQIAYQILEETLVYKE